MPRALLMQAKTTNGATGSQTVYFSKPDAEFIVWGTFDGATVILQSTPDAGVTWLPVELNGVTVSVTENSTVPNLEVSSGETLRAFVSGGGGSMSLSAEVRSLYA